ncbi:MAG: AbrB/MazE/SpoVT family DNA-binding domain-containing protein [Bradymonadales bacterium]|nr:MAG: AbrB/MazE/SpoVT family DNA-binding domain-containing protein [Bradymonadales bacterium]
MVKKLVKHGNSLALILDRPVLDLLHINEETSLDISTVDGKSLQITPISEAERQKQFSKALKKVNKKYKHTLQNLAK